MKRRTLIVILLLLIAFLSTGFYIVKGNEKAVVRRFGKVVTAQPGTVALVGSGLHYDLPWPLARIERINLNEVRTLAIGVAEVEDFAATGFLQSVDAAQQSQFLTGDTNVLHIQLHLLYRISEADPESFLFRSESAERHLKLLAESCAADLISRSGVDYVHPLGLGELRQMLTSRTRELATRHRLGIEVEEVSVNAVYPPVRVKSYFLDVANARADKQNYINSALAYAEQRRQTAGAESRQILDEAQIVRTASIESAGGQADSFTKVIGQLRLEEQQGTHSYDQARQMAMRRLYMETMQDILGKVAGKVLLDSGDTVDLTISGTRKSDASKQTMYLDAAQSLGPTAETPPSNQSADADDDSDDHRS